MPNWFQMLCAVDFTEASRTTLEQAADLARRLGAELTILHVRESGGKGELGAAMELLETEADELGRKLRSWKDAAERSVGRPIRMLLADGPAGSEIVRVATEDRCDLIVIGTHGQRGVRRLVLGSVAEKVVRDAPCAVLVARPPPDHGD